MPPIKRTETRREGETASRKIPEAPESTGTSAADEIESYHDKGSVAKKATRKELEERKNDKSESKNKGRSHERTQPQFGSIENAGERQEKLKVLR
jgi:hypothetical protein